MTENPTTTTENTIALTWEDLVTTVTDAGDGVFLATADPDGRPHVAFVAPGWGDQCLWISTFASSQKAANLRRRAEVAMTCAPSPDVNVLIRAVARCVDDPAEIAQRWAEGVVPYDPSAFFSGPDDPEALFVELRPTAASIHSLAPGPVRRWRPT